MQEIDFAFNMNYLGPPEGTDLAGHNSVDAIFNYPDPKNKKLVHLVSRFFEVKSESIAFGAGATDIIYTLARLLKTEGSVLTPIPTFWEYEHANKIAGSTVKTMQLDEDQGFKWSSSDIEGNLEGVKTVYLCNPNNPTSFLQSPQELMTLIRKYPGINFVVDETYLLFLEGFDEKSLIHFASEEVSNLYVVISHSKFFAIPGARIGTLITSPSNVESYNGIHTPYMMHASAYSLLEHTLSAEEYIEKTRRQYKQRIDKVVGEAAKYLDSTKCKILPPMGPFMMIKMLDDRLAQDVTKELSDGLEKNSVVRDCSDMPGLTPKWIRAAIRGKKEMAFLFKSLGTILK